MGRKKEKREAFREVEIEHPGYLGSQDISMWKISGGIGRIYQQTFIGTYTRVAFANCMKPSTLSLLQIF